MARTVSSSGVFLPKYKFLFKKKNPKLDEPQKPKSRCYVNSWRAHAYQKIICTPDRMSTSSFTQSSWTQAIAATWPPQWREMVQGFVSAFPSMAWGWLCPRPRRQPVSGCSRWGVWVEKTVESAKAASARGCKCRLGQIFV